MLCILIGRVWTRCALCKLNVVCEKGAIVCGIAGFIHRERGKGGCLQEMANAIRRRGPDDVGVFEEPYDNGHYIGLCHRRLSIIDLSSNGHQPMMDKERRIVVVFNGEIYNFRTIRKELQNKGCSFSSDSDTEVLIYAYKVWGIDFVHKLNGMFSIALYDRSTKDFYLIRDRMGVKPLYYTLSSAGLVFGSELKSLCPHPGFEKKIDRHGLSLFLFHGYIAAPHTIFENTYKLKPGTYLHFKNGCSEIKKYWSIEEVYQNSHLKNGGCLSEEDWVEKISSHLEETIESRLISDVPIGCFLSGGVDSSLVAAIMQKVSSEKIKTFTIGFHEPSFNEADYAKDIADRLGTDHHEAYFSMEDAKNFVPRLPSFYDEPFADSSQLPMLMLSQFARQYVTVALSGDGGDELFCGYDRYADVLKLERLSMLSRVGRYVPFLESFSRRVFSNSKVGQFFELTNDMTIINSAYLNYLKKSSLIKDYVPVFDRGYCVEEKMPKHIQERYMLLDLQTYLPDDILTKVDRASMAFSLEARVPFIDDHTFVEMSFDVPLDLKYKEGEKKYLLKKVLERYVPRSFFDRPKKGFGVPVNQWLRSGLSHLVDDALDPSYVRDQNIFSEREICLLKDRFNSSAPHIAPTSFWDHIKRDGVVDRTVWYMMVFQMWYREFMEFKGA